MLKLTAKGSKPHVIDSIANGRTHKRRGERHNRQDYDQLDQRDAPGSLDSLDSLMGKGRPQVFPRPRSRRNPGIAPRPNRYDCYLRHTRGLLWNPRHLQRVFPAFTHAAPFLFENEP